MNYRLRFSARSTVAKIALAGLAAGGAMAVGIVGSPLPASANDPGTSNTAVYPDDLSSNNVSSSRTVWDATGVSQFAAFPATGTRWALDIENKPRGTAAISANGLTLSVSTSPAPTKVRFQYYIGTGGYPAIDSQTPTLADVLALPLGWQQTLVSGASDYGPTLQMLLEKEISPGVFDRVTISNIWNPGTGPRNFGASPWFSDSNIHADGYLQGAIVSEAKNGDPGVSSDVLKTNFGDFRVVSFGPNLGRDFQYDYKIQDFAILGQTFHFTPDTTPPAVVITGGASIPTSETSPSITGTTDAAIGTTVTVTVAGQSLIATVATGGTWSVTSETLAIGTHTVVVSITDPSGNTGTATTLLTVNEKQQPASPPAADTNQLTTLIAQGNLDVSSTTSTFVPLGGTIDNPLDSLDVSKAFSGTLPWSDGTDSFVDVYAYSSPTFLGTFPVINGKVQLSGLDLSALRSGGHHLVFQGQTSGAVQVMAVTVAETLAATGLNLALPLGLTSILILLGLALRLLTTRTRRA